MDNQKIVNFHQFCPKCKHFSKPEEEFPCDYCLLDSARPFSNQPKYFESSNKRSKSVSSRKKHTL